MRTVFVSSEHHAPAIFVNVSVGGGIRSLDEVDKLLRIGVDKIAINSAAVRKPKFLEQLVNIYGSSTISVNVETAKINIKYEIFIETGREKTGLELFEWIDTIQKMKARRTLKLSDIDPIIGSVIASNTVAIAVAKPTKAGETPRTWL